MGSEILKNPFPNHQDAKVRKEPPKRAHGPEGAQDGTDNNDWLKDIRHPDEDFSKKIKNKEIIVRKSFTSAALPFQHMHAYDRFARS